MTSWWHNNGLYDHVVRPGGGGAAEAAAVSQLGVTQQQNGGHPLPPRLPRTQHEYITWTTHTYY